MAFNGAEGAVLDFFGLSDIEKQKKQSNFSGWISKLLQKFLKSIFEGPHFRLPSQKVELSIFSEGRVSHVWAGVSPTVGPYSHGLCQTSFYRNLGPVPIPHGEGQLDSNGIDENLSLKTSAVNTFHLALNFLGPNLDCL